MQREQARRSRCWLVCLFVYLLARSLACLLALLPACLLSQVRMWAGAVICRLLLRAMKIKRRLPQRREMSWHRTPDSASETLVKLCTCRSPGAFHTRQLLLSHTSAHGTHGLQFRPQNHVNWINYMKIYMSTPPLPTEPTKESQTGSSLVAEQGVVRCKHF